MRYHRTVVFALVVCTAIGASGSNARAQNMTSKSSNTQNAFNRYAPNTANRNTQKTAVRRAQHIEPAMPGHTEELPMGHTPVPSRLKASSSPFADDNFTPEGFHPSADSFSGGYGDGSCDSCGDCSTGCGSGCGDACGRGECCSQWFVTGDYLNVRAHFSEALSYVERVSSLAANPPQVEQIFHQFDFEYESSFRVAGGWRDCCCGDEIRFTYTQLKSSASDSVVPPGQGSNVVILVPYIGDTPVIEADEVAMRASVDIDSFDLEYRKTIPLGGSLGASCGDCCESDCPAWDITWSGGIRGANVDWNRSYAVVNGTGVPTGNPPVAIDIDRVTTSDLDFSGAGPRVGVEGRRYFGKQGWFSIFMQGNVSLLLGEVELQTRQLDTATDLVLIETFNNDEIIPVTEIETGMSANFTSNTAFTAGYLFNAWHDLGFRENAALPPLQLNAGYDDANILSFDGFFARVEWSY